MSNRPQSPLSPRLLLVAVAFAAATPAQVPPGWCVVSAHKEDGAAYTGDGGIYLTAPRTPMAMHLVAGLPDELTAATVPFPFPQAGPKSLGANCILMHRSGDLLVAPVAQANQAVELHRVPIVGSPSTGFSAGAITTILLGTAGASGGGIAQMAFVTDDVVLVAGRYVSGPMGTPGPHQIALVDLTTQVVTPLTPGTLPRPALVPNSLIADIAGITYAAGTDTVSIGLRANTTGIPGLTAATSWICSFQLAAPSPALVTWMAGTMTNLATRRITGGSETLASLFVGSNSGRPVLYQVAAGGAVTVLLPNTATSNWDVVNAIAIEPSTGEVLFCGNSIAGSLPTGGVHWLDSTSGTTHQLANTLASNQPRGPLTGIAMAPALTRSGTVSSCNGGPVECSWSYIPHPDKLPLAGNLNFFVDIAPGTIPGFALGCVGLAPLTPPSTPLPQCPGLTLLVAPMAWGPLTGPMSNQLHIPLPGWLSGSTIYTQCASWTQNGPSATDLLRIDIL
ncbi:MAG: hypothetical protein KDC48_07690 [Planctomycetes bacterium]|nr:hypothetical protein [Planctomycetota bacterium]